MKKTKIVLKNIGIGAGIFFAFFLAAFIILITGIHIFYEKNLINETIFAVIIFSGAFAVGIATVVVFFIKKKKNRYKLFSGIGTKILFYTYLLSGFLGAFKTELILSQESAQKLVEIEWTIFSIAVTVFVFWHVVVSKFIENQPNKTATGKTRIQLLSQKIKYYKNAGNFFYSLILLMLALISLTLVTASAYIMDINYYIQFVSIFNIYIVIDALMVIFYDIAVPLCAELFLSKKYKLSDQQVLDEVQLAILEELLKQKDISLSDEQITDIAQEAIKKIKQGSEESEPTSDTTEELTITNTADNLDKK